MQKLIQNKLFCYKKASIKHVSGIGGTSDDHKHEAYRDHKHHSDQHWSRHHHHVKSAVIWGLERREAGFSARFTDTSPIHRISKINNIKLVILYYK